MCNDTEKKREIEMSEEKKKRIVHYLMNRERSGPNIERGGFINPSKETYYGRSPFVPTKTMLDQSRGIFKDKDECSDE